MGASIFLQVILGRIKSSGDSVQLRHLVPRFHLLAKAVKVVENYWLTMPRVKTWLLQVESALVDIIDMLDELQMGEAGLSNKARLKSAQAHKIETIRRVLDEILKATGSLERFQPSLSNPDDESDPLLIGRESNKSRIIDLILASVDDKFCNVSVLPLVGFMGIGKTALAPLIYLDSRIRGNFNVRLWVSLAGEVPDILDILKQVTPLATQDESSLSLTELLTAHSKIFIVIDDCHEDHRRLTLTRELVDILPGGSAIIMTTRSERVAALFGTMPPYQLERLSLDDSYELFKRCSLPASSNRPENVSAMEIFKLCRGIPSVAKAIGTFLSSKTDPGQWEKELSRLQNGTGDGITPYLAFNCCDTLPSYLKELVWTFQLQTRCRLTVDELICLWMALGFLSCELKDPDDPTQQPEYIARKYLKEFAKTAVFTNVGYAPGGFIRDMALDDLVYDLARSTFLNQLWVHGHSTTSKQDESPARYSIWDTVYVPGETLPSSSLPNANKTRLFMLCHGRQASEELVRDVVSSFKCLRVLGLGGSDIQMLPDSIGSLKHLRYLDVGRNARMKRLPDSICQLGYLQTLLLNGCSQLEQIPENIGRLQSLRYLTLTIQQTSLPEQIGLLSSLKTLGLASCPRLASLPHSINLKSLETLGIVDCQMFELKTSSVDRLKWVNGGTLLLSGLPKLDHFPSSLGNASFSLKHLMIQSCETLTNAKEISKLRSLCSLTIEDCRNLSNLTDNASQFHNIVELVIRDCPSLADTAWITQFVSLRSLVIDACPNMLALDGGFAGLKYLERLEIRSCPHLTNRCVSPGGEDWPLIAHVLLIELAD